MTRWRWLPTLLLAGLLAAGCDEPFEPFERNDAAHFSVYGYLDLNADTQWVRVMPVRQSLFLAPDPIDATVTLENLGSGRVVTLRDSLFSFRDDRLGAVAYAHNFWTAERLEPGATYRLTAKRSDGAATTATTTMPDDGDILFRNQVPLAGTIAARTGYLLYVDVLYLVRDGCSNADLVHPIRQRPRVSAGVLPVRVDSLRVACYSDYGHREIHAVVTRPGWPFPPELSDVDVAVPGRVPSGVEDGVGFVAGVATWTIPFQTCAVLAPRPGRAQPCELSYDASSTSVAGRVVRQPCGAPAVSRPIRLVEEFPAGGAIVRTWSSGPNGEYRFQGLEPGSRLTVELEPGVASLRLPPLGPGERYLAGEIPVPC